MLDPWRATICSAEVPEAGAAPQAEPLAPSAAGGADAAARPERVCRPNHILGPGQLLRRAIEADRIQSLIFYGPPGTGKTSLAQIIARQTRSKFERLSGVESNVADMRRVLAPRPTGSRTRANPPSCSLTKSTASTRRSRTCCCRMSRAAWCG